MHATSAPCTVPPQLSKLHQLDILYLDDTRVSGTIAPELGNMFGLDFLYLGGTPISGTPLSALYPSADPMALGLLSQLLAFDPRKRRTATEALASPYLGELHAMNDAPDAPRLDGTDAFAFEHDESDKSDLKALVWRELQHFHPELASAAPPPTFADSPTRVMELELSCDEPSVP